MHRLPFNSKPALNRIVFWSLIVFGLCSSAARGQQSPHGPLSIACTDCHSTESWKTMKSPLLFKHSKTDFPLEGSHAQVPCKNCHVQLKFTATAGDCFSCHQKAFADTKTPDHATGRFPHDCQSCHTTVSWRPSIFNHDKTNFPLSGPHRTLECTTCHAGGRFAGTSADCFSCHRQDFAAATNPNHALAGFSRECTQCHLSNAWTPSTFNHSQTNFPLTGAHLTTECLFCHKNQQFKGIATDCFSCHQTDFAATRSPDHTTGGFSHDCTTCHTTVAWTPASFDHSQASFQLTGAHLRTACQACHINSRYAGTPTDCQPCHQTHYANTTNPNHTAAMFPTTCQTCHTTMAWTPSTWDHTPFFPIATGAKHRPGIWNFCSDCHISTSDMKVFSCLTCHEHDQIKMDDKHKEIQGYQYLSSQCYRCHPQGRS